MAWEDIIKVETSSRGFMGENLPESKKERLRDLKEDLEYRKLMLSNLKTLESSLLPFTKGMVGHLPKMEKRMKDMMDFVKPLIPHYKQLIKETEESIKNIGE
tara:strand:- start:947 stop:1252 length:306 start_codon:yes stop_codon:yes gene_type:complete